MYTAAYTAPTGSTGVHSPIVNLDTQQPSAKLAITANARILAGSTGALGACQLYLDGTQLDSQQVTVAANPNVGATITLVGAGTASGGMVQVQCASPSATFTEVRVQAIQVNAIN